jgi:signal transduction histidine kinase
VDPGELDTIILNLILNSLYWIQQSRRKGQLEFNVSKLQGGQRVRLTVHDSGTGVADEDVDKIFLPGVTRKPDGIGMGLTVAAELVSEYGGRMCLLRPGRLGGASFAFDLPVKGYTIREDAH